MTNDPQALDEINDRLVALELQSRIDRDTLYRTRRQVRGAWPLAFLIAVAAFTVGGHKDTITQGYGVVLAHITRVAAPESQPSATERTTPNNLLIATR